MGRAGIGAIHLSLVAAFCAVGCGMAGGTHGGDSNLPHAAVSPYTKVEGDPDVALLGTDVRFPSVDGDASGPKVLWAGVSDAGSGQTDAVLRWELDPAEGWQPSGAVFVAEQATWEAGRVSAPFVIRRGGELLLLYVGGAGAGLGLARSTDGVNWERDPNNPIVSPTGWEDDGDAPLGSPSLALHPDGSSWIWYTAASGAAVAAVRETPDGGWTRVADAPLFEPQVGPDGDVWERDRIVSCRVFRAQSPLGRAMLRMWYAGARQTSGGGLDTGVGFAGSFDGVAWDRAVSNPVLRLGGFGEKDAFEWRDARGSTLFFAEFWKRDGSNRHVLRNAAFGDGHGGQPAQEADAAP
jgi:hypothetical protein